ncbi:hypothetical protein THAOC_19856 [Thalassiosira oceanica]|uniref:Uncharacterized protein n=1 Tax=Thalassiosira oceanica TaxID=159749 RepID=K0SN15_THAOC|nr:hypothetical protein THAOC_19856 [Thalassiosira oceanica]|eukprot:EJK59867.1 hypothetical protein THAOC_19856 [Thalassiosira oceanica]
MTTLISRGLWNLSSTWRSTSSRKALAEPSHPSTANKKKLSHTQSSVFKRPIQELQHARTLVLSEISSTRVVSEMARHDWIDDSPVYFELVGDVETLFDDVLFIANRQHANGLEVISMFYEGTVMVVVRDGTGLQPLLNVHYPTIPPSNVGARGATLATYEGVSKRTWMRLGVYQLLDQPNPVEASMDLSNDSYTQSYCILKSQRQGAPAEVLFRFNSWLYSGDVGLPSDITLGSIPEVVVSMRVQQSRLTFIGDVSSVPKTNKFVNYIEHARDVGDFAECLAMESQDAISDLATNAKWIESGDCFLKFTCSDGENTMDGVKVFAQKTYRPSGVLTILIFHCNAWYFALDDQGCQQKLLDSKFPDLSRVGDTVVLKGFENGSDGWPQLRQVSLCRRAGDSDEADSREQKGVGKSSDQDEPSDIYALLDRLDLTLESELHELRILGVHND